MKKKYKRAAQIVADAPDWSNSRFCCTALEEQHLDPGAFRETFMPSDSDIGRPWFMFEEDLEGERQLARSIALLLMAEMV